MKLVVGLGNPGNQYNFTRHNTGFLALDFYFKVKGLTWNEHPKFGAIYKKETIDGEDAIFIKPQDYYNASGKAVREFARFYKIPTSDIMIICDNFDLEFGKIRYRSSGAAAGNNGLKSVDQELGTPEYPRLRIGTGNDALRRQMGDVDFVLSRFTPEERAALPNILQDTTVKIDQFAANAL